MQGNFAEFRGRDFLTIYKKWLACPTDSKLFQKMYNTKDKS